MPRRATAPKDRSSRGFSLVEALVVVAVLAVLAGLVIPRMGGVRRREEGAVVDRVADLMTMFAFRSSAGTQPVGILHDAASRSLELVILDIDPTQDGDPLVWQPDRLSMPVLLPDGMDLAEATEDSSLLPEGDWMVTSKPGGDRPRLEIRLAGRALEASVSLEPHALHPRRSDRQVAGAREPRDLDEEGMDRERW